MPDTTSGSVAELFMNLVCLPSVITATDPDLPERPRAVSFHYHPPRISNQRPDAPDIWRIGFAAIAEAMVTHRANLYDKSRPLSARCGIGLCIDRSATGPVAKVLEVDVVGATPKSGLVDWDPTNWMSIDVN